MLIDDKIKGLELDRKRKATEEHKKDVIETFTEGNKRRWTVDSAIPNSERNNVYFVDPMKDSVPFLDMIQRGEFVALYGACTSGKSTCVIQVKEQLIDEGFICIYVTLELVNIESVDKFWISLGHSFEIDGTSDIKFAGIKSASEFARFFSKDKCKKRVVLFIDEYDVLYEA
ncbi:9525_t:CDS:2, partial [Entrophospora sp. SA101]